MAHSPRELAHLNRNCDDGFTPTLPSTSTPTLPLLPSTFRLLMKLIIESINKTKELQYSECLVCIDTFFKRDSARCSLSLVLLRFIVRAIRAVTDSSNARGMTTPASAKFRVAETSVHGLSVLIIANMRESKHG